MTDEEVVNLWRKEVIQYARNIDAMSGKGGHDWQSLWIGFVIALKRPDLATYYKYMRLGFPQEQYADQPWEFKDA